MPHQVTKSFAGRELGRDLHRLICRIAILEVTSTLHNLLRVAHLQATKQPRPSQHMWVTVCRHRLEDAEPHSDEESGKQEPEGEEEEEEEWAPCTLHSHFILT